MRRPSPTKADIVAALRRLASESPDGRVSLSAFKNETDWDRYWFDKHWPVSGYRGACEEAGVLCGQTLSEANPRITDKELAVRFAEAVQVIGKVPTLKRFSALARMGLDTITRGNTYPDAKRRIIEAYFELPSNKRTDEKVEEILREELSKLNGVDGGVNEISAPTVTDLSKYGVQVLSEYVSLVRAFSDRGEEEKRQLVAEFFHKVLGYKRARVRSEHERNDVRVHNRCDEPWLVVEVKSSLATERDRKAARRQGFDYAHRWGMRLVVISDGDYYEVFDRHCGQRLRYDEMRQGSFHVTSLRSRDSDLLGLLASER